MGRTMRRLILLQLCLFLFAGVASAEFRGIPWGASMQEVLESEGEPINKNEAIMQYKVEIGGLSADAAFSFIDNRLVSGHYFFSEQHSNRNLFLEDFNRVRELLTKKYQKPSYDRVHWNQKFYKNDPEHWGTAVAAGHLALLVQWETADSRIHQMLSGDNLEIRHSIRYTSLSLGHLEEQKNEAEALKQL